MTDKNADDYRVSTDGSNFVENCGKVQREIYGLDVRRPGYVKDMATAAMVECAELIQSTDWKQQRDGLDNLVDRPVLIQHSREELVDALIFLGNCATALGLTTAGLWREVDRKVQINIRRRLGKDTV